jgi:hypothetical protein
MPISWEIPRLRFFLCIEEIYVLKKSNVIRIWMDWHFAERNNA